MASSPFADAISGIESGGQYGLLGPVTKSDRAYGKFQVMGANIPSWTKQFYGESLTPQQFLNNPAAQDAVFQGKFGQYVQKYGPEGAARAWFAGEGGMNNPNARDVLGTTVAQYAQKFTNGLGPSYTSFSSPPLTPGTQAPPLPPPITIGGPQSSQSAPLMAAAPQQQQKPAFNPMAVAGLFGNSSRQEQMPAPPQFAPNPIQAMAMLQPQPDTKGLQQLLAKAPVLRGLIV